MADFPNAGITLPDGANLEQVIHAVRFIQTQIARNLATVQRQQAADPARLFGKNALVQGVVDLYTMEGPVTMRIANRPSPGQVLYAVDTLHLAFGDAANPAPTGTGTPPLLGGFNALLDGVYHTDTLAGAVVLGDLVHGNGTPKWARLAGQITATRKFLRQTGTGAVSAVPVWDTLLAADIPTLAAAGGWTDDGTVVRLTTSTDQVGVGTASPGACFAVLNVNATSDIVALLKAKASQSGDMLQIYNSSGRNLAKFNSSGNLCIGNSTDFQDAVIVLGGKANAAGEFQNNRSYVTWGDSAGTLSDPTCTTSYVSCLGARLLFYKDATGQYDTVYGQSGTSSWVMVSDETITYDFWTGGLPASVTPFLRCSSAGNGDYTNYGFIHSRKSLGAVTKGVPGIRLEETGSGTDYIKVQAPAAVAAGSRLQTLLDLNGTIPIVGDDPPAVASKALGKVDSTNLGAAVASTNLTNGATAGIYAVQYYLEDTTADITAGTITVTVAFTDDVGATTQVSGALALTAVGRVSGQFVLYLASGELAYSTTLTGIIGTSKYALRMRVVFLG